MVAWVVGIVTASNGKGSSEDRGARSSLSARPHSPPSLQPPNNPRVCELLPSYVSQPHVWPRVQLMKARAVEAERASMAGRALVEVERVR